MVGADMIMTDPWIVDFVKGMQNYDKLLNRYREDMIARNLDPNTIRRYIRICIRAKRLLKADSRTVNPHKIAPSDILYLKSKLPGSWTLRVLGTFLEYAGNNVLRRMRINWPKDNRTRVNWLSEKNHRVLSALAQPGIERAIVHLAMELGFRRIEIQRLRMDNIHECTIDIHGKGRGGGKVARSFSHSAR